jgi:hypothetical protein
MPNFNPIGTVLYYSSESWTLARKSESALDAFETEKNTWPNARKQYMEN